MRASRKKVPAGSIALVMVGLIGVACGSSAPSAPSTTGAPQGATATPSAMAAGGFRADIEAMLEARDTIHPDGWFGMDRGYPG